MKKILIYSLLCLCAAKQLKGQESVLFKIKYSPDKNYNSKVSINMNCKANLAGDTAVINKFKSQGITQPLSVIMDMAMVGNIKTGTKGVDKNFPVKIDYNFDHLNMTLNGNEMPVPQDKLKAATIIYGHAGTDGKLKADSINGKSKDTSEKAVTQLLNSIQNKIIFPDHPMRVGDTFTQNLPLNLPIAGNTMDANSKAVYKLTNITDGVAYFDIQQSMDITIPVAGATIIMTGKGSGKLVYSIKDNFPTDYNSNINLKVTGEIKELRIDATAIMNMEYKYKIN